MSTSDGTSGTSGHSTDHSTDNCTNDRSALLDCGKSLVDGLTNSLTNTTGRFPKGLSPAELSLSEYSAVIVDVIVGDNLTVLVESDQIFDLA